MNCDSEAQVVKDDAVDRIINNGIKKEIVEEADFIKCEMPKENFDPRSSNEEVKRTECCTADKQEDSVIKLIEAEVTVKWEQYVDIPEYLPTNIDFAECEKEQIKTEDDINIAYENENIIIETIKAEPVNNEASLNSDMLVQDRDSKDIKPSFFNKSLKDCGIQLYHPIEVDDTNEVVLQCKVCSIPFSSKNNITHTCEVCLKSLNPHPSSETQTLSHSKGRHEGTHAGKKRVPCKVCSKLFSSRYDLLIHQRIHTEEKPFDCKVCLKSFSVRSKLVRHERIHTEGKPFDCIVCLKNFSTASRLLEHEQIHSGKKPFDCKVCSKRFSTRPNLAQHERIHTGEKQFQCKVCSKTFYTRSVLVEHERIHTGEKPFHCKICSKSFSVRSNLLQHERFHSGEKPFDCKVCSKPFSTKSQLVKHELIHTGEKPFGCKVCSKSFYTKYDLAQHERVHTGEKPFDCRICSKSFTNVSNRSKHEKTHKTEKSSH